MLIKSSSKITRFKIRVLLKQCHLISFVVLRVKSTVEGTIIRGPHGIHSYWSSFSLVHSANTRLLAVWTIAGSWIQKLHHILVLLLCDICPSDLYLPVSPRPVSLPPGACTSDSSHRGSCSLWVPDRGSAHACDYLGKGQSASPYRQKVTLI